MAKLETTKVYEGKKLSLKYSGDAFGGPAFMTVDCKLIPDKKLIEMMNELFGD